MMMHFENHCASTMVSSYFRYMQVRYAGRIKHTPNAG